MTPLPLPPTNFPVKPLLIIYFQTLEHTRPQINYNLIIMNSSLLKNVKYEIPCLQQVELELCQISREDRAMERLLNSMLARSMFWEEKMIAIKRKSDEKT